MAVEYPWKRDLAMIPSHICSLLKVFSLFNIIGMYRSQTRRRYSIDGRSSSVDHEFDLTEEITFIECNPAPAVYRVRHSGYYVVYNENELTTRFVMMSQTEAAQGML